MSDVTLVPGRLPKPIAQMGAWDFWADARAIGLPPEEAEAVNRGEATEEQLAHARLHGMVAKNALIVAGGGIEHGRPS